MPNQGYTITPVSYEDQATGEQIIEDFQVVGTQAGEDARTNDVRQQEEMFVVDEDGQTHYQSTMSNGDYENLIDGYGGHETYTQVSAWAEQNFSPEDVAGYNAILERGDLTEVASAMEQVFQLWNDRNETGAEPAELDVDVEDSDADWVFQTIIPEADYKQLTDYAAEHYEDSWIENFNLIMESGSRELMAKTIDLLRTKVNEE